MSESLLLMFLISLELLCCCGKFVAIARFIVGFEWHLTLREFLLGALTSWVLASVSKFGHFKVQIQGFADL